MKPLRRQNRPVMRYKPRVEPAPPSHPGRVEGFDNVWMARGKYVAFVLAGGKFHQSPPFAQPDAAQRWAEQMRQEYDT